MTLSTKTAKHKHVILITLQVVLFRMNVAIKAMIQECNNEYI